MTKSLLEQAADNVGWATYLFVVGGGVPFWPALFLPSSDDTDEVIEQPAALPTATPPPLFDPPYIGVRSLELVPVGEAALIEDVADFAAA